MTNLSPIESGAIRRAAPASAKADVAEIRSPSKARRGDDQVDVSDKARFLAKLNNMPDIRSDLVARVREEIAKGEYDTPERFDLAVDAMIDESL